MLLPAAGRRREPIMKEQIHKCSKKQKKAARAAFGCLVLLLLYGCAGQGKRAEAVTFLPETGVSGDGQANGPQTGEADARQEEQEALTDAHAASSDGHEKAETADARAQQEPDIYAVYVCGAVKNPGVYELPAGSRVYEAVLLAGGLTDDALETAVNQAELLADGQMVRIPTKEEADALADESRTEAKEDGLVNINTADLEELKTLPGIGDAKAQSIISYREKNGAFLAIEDIKNIEGIKEGVFARLEGLIKVD